MNESQNEVYVCSGTPIASLQSQTPASSRGAINEALDAFTTLKATAGLASKRVVARPQGTPTVIGFNAGAFYYPFEIPVSNITELSVKLSVVEKQRDCLVIRGAPRPDLDCNRRQRRRKTNFPTPQCGRRWISIDCDKIPLPQGLKLQQDISAVCEHLIGLLPREFHEASYHWQLSSSAGITDPSVVSLHLWFWLDRPIPDASLKAWAVHWNGKAGIKLIDPALFNDVQAHYTAAPAFEGLCDPFPVRSGLVRKAIDEVALKLPPPRKTPAVRPGAKLIQPSGGFETFLAQIGDHEGGLGFHGPFIWAVASHVAKHGRDGTDIEALCEVLRAQLLKADRSNHTDDYVEQMASREHVLRAIEQALDKFGGPNPRRKSRRVPGVPPHFASRPVDAAAAKAELHTVVDRFFGQHR